MCQRVLLAAALAGDPALLVADEPSASLDALSRQHVLDLLGRVRWERGLALLLISHDRQAIDALCGRVLRVEGGRLVQEAERTGAARMRERACLAPA